MVSIGYTYFLVLRAPSGSWEGKQELAALEVNTNVKPRPVPHRLVTWGLRLKPIDLWQGNKTNYTAGLLWTSDNTCKASGHRRGRAMGFQYTSIDPPPFDVIILRTIISTPALTWRCWPVSMRWGRWSSGLNAGFWSQTVQSESHLRYFLATRLWGNYWSFKLAPVREGGGTTVPLPCGVAVIPCGLYGTPWGCLWLS